MTKSQNTKKDLCITSDTPVQALDICEITLEKTALGELCVTCYNKRNNQFVYRMVAKNKNELVEEIKRAQRKSMQEYDNIIAERLKSLDELIQVKNQMDAIYNESIHKIEES